jgi:hypothetical protein
MMKNDKQVVPLSVIFFFFAVLVIILLLMNGV